MPDETENRLAWLGPHAVPGLWTYMLPPEIWELRIPSERRATCSNCPRIVTDAYRTDYRCCTYHPRVPNFLLGLALQDGKMSQAAVERAYAAGFLMPEGMQPSPQAWANFLVDVGEERFGQSEQVLCPMLERETGRCGIYAFRNSICSTFFCHYDHGSRGEQFWDSLQTFVLQIEMAIGQWALQQIGFDVPAYIARLEQLSDDIHKASERRTQQWSKLARRTAWGKHFGQELAVYRACADVVLAHKQELWKIANATPIMEPLRFEGAAQSVVPERHRDQIEDDLAEREPDGSDTASPRELWRDVKRAYKRLWQLPVSGQHLRLSKRAILTANEKADSEARAFSKYPVRLDFLTRSGSKHIRWRQFLNEREGKALAALRSPQPWSTETINRLRLILEDNPESFVSEWLGKKVLETY